MDLEDLTDLEALADQVDLAIPMDLEVLEDPDTQEILAVTLLGIITLMLEVPPAPLALLDHLEDKLNPKTKTTDDHE